MSVEKIDTDELKRQGLNNLAELLEGHAAEENGEDLSEGGEDDNDTVSSLFEGIEVPEGFLEKAKVIVEAAAIEKATALNEAFMKSMEATVEQALQEQAEQQEKEIDAYLSYVANEWMEENKVAVKNNLKVQIAESFIDGLKGLLSEHAVDVSDEQVDLVEGLTLELDESQDQLKAVLVELAEAKQELEKVQCNAILESATKDLVETEKDRFVSILGEMEYNGVEDFQNKVDILLSTFKKSDEQVVESETTEIEVPSEETIEESVQEVSEEVIEETIDPRMASYIKALRPSGFSKTNKK